MSFVKAYFDRVCIALGGVAWGLYIQAWAPLGDWMYAVAGTVLLLIPRWAYIPRLLRRITTGALSERARAWIAPVVGLGIITYAIAVLESNRPQSVWYTPPCRRMNRTKRTPTARCELTKRFRLEKGCCPNQRADPVRELLSCRRRLFTCASQRRRLGPAWPFISRSTN